MTMTVQDAREMLEGNVEFGSHRTIRPTQRFQVDFGLLTCHHRTQIIELRLTVNTGVR
jgi:hypothetical protein